MFQADFKIDVICLKEIFQNLFNRFPPHFVQMFGGTASAWPHSFWNVQKVTFGWPLDDRQGAEWDAVGGVGSSVAWVYHQSFFCLWISVFLSSS